MKFVTVDDLKPEPVREVDRGGGPLMGDAPPVIATCEPNYNGCYPVRVTMDLFSTRAATPGGRLVELLDLFRKAGVSVPEFTPLRESMIEIQREPTLGQIFVSILDGCGVKQWQKTEDMVRGVILWRLLVKP